MSYLIGQGERFEDHPAEKWIPVRYLNAPVECDFCRFTIPAGSPGRTRGSRGTRAWWNPWRRVYECLGCRSEGFRAEAARQVEEDAARLARLRGAA